MTFRAAIGALGASVTAWPCSCGTASGRDGGDRLRPVPGQRCAAARRAVGLPPEGRGESCRPATARPPATLAAYHRSPAALLSPGCSRQLALPVPAVGVARRRCALEAVEKVVTGNRAFGHPAAAQRPGSLRLPARRRSSSYQSAWTTVPLCSVTTVALAIHAGTAEDISGQLIVSCQCLAMPAGDS